MNIIVKTLIGFEYRINVSNQDTCAQLREKIQSTCGFLPNEQVLIFENTDLSNGGSKLIANGIKNESVIYLTFKLNQFKVVVGSPCGKSIKIPVNSQNTVKSLKDEIQKQLSFPVEEQTLMFREEILENNKKLSEYGIDKECIISLIPKLQDSTKNKIEIQNVDVNPSQFNDMNQFPGGLLKLNRDRFNLKPKVQKKPDVETFNAAEITCKKISGEAFQISIDLNKDVKDLKNLIFKNIGLLPAEQRLVFQTKLLEDNKTLVSCEIQDKSEIIIVPKPRHSHFIICKTSNEKYLSLYVNDNETINQVKRKIEDLLNTKIDKHGLFYNNELLGDFKTVKECGLQDKSVIYMKPFL